MSSTNKTTNIELSQYIATDKPTYLVDYNGDMLKIDNAIGADRESIATAQSTANTADGKADANATAIQSLDTELNDPATGIAAGLADVVGDVNTIQSLIGNGEPTTTDKTIIGAINELNSDIQNLDTDDGIYIFLGDSYESYSGWAAKTAVNLGLSNDRFVNLCQDSTNIASGAWLTILTTWVTNNPTLVGKVTHVIGGGGINDSSADALPNLDTAIGNLTAYIKGNLPKAKFYLSYFGFGREASPILMNRTWIYRAQAQSIYSQCGKHGAIYLKGLEGVLHNVSLLDSDGLHPNAQGGAMIAAYLASAINTGAANVSYPITNASYSPYDDNSTASGDIHETLNDGIYTIWIANLAVTGIADTVVQAGTGVGTNIVKDVALNIGEQALSVDCAINVVDQNDTLHTLNGILYIGNGYMQFLTRGESSANFYVKEIKPINLKVSVSIMYA